MCTLRFPSVVFMRFFRSLKLSASLAASALMIPRRNRSCMSRSKLGAALFDYLRPPEGQLFELASSCVVCFAIDCLATVSPRNNDAKNQM